MWFLVASGLGIWPRGGLRGANQFADGASASSLLSRSWEGRAHLTDQPAPCSPPEMARSFVVYVLPCNTRKAVRFGSVQFGSARARERCASVLQAHAARAPRDCTARVYYPSCTTVPPSSAIVFVDLGKSRQAADGVGTRVQPSTAKC